jgi:hypothetical protein
VDWFEREGIPLSSVGAVLLVGEYALEPDFRDVSVFTITRLARDLAGGDTWYVGFNTLRASH